MINNSIKHGIRLLYNNKDCYCDIFEKYATMKKSTKSVFKLFISLFKDLKKNIVVSENDLSTLVRILMHILFKIKLSGSEKSKITDLLNILKHIRDYKNDSNSSSTSTKSTTISKKTFASDTAEYDNKSNDESSKKNSNSSSKKKTFVSDSAESKKVFKKNKKKDSNKESKSNTSSESKKCTKNKKKDSSKESKSDNSSKYKSKSKSDNSSKSKSKSKSKKCIKDNSSKNKLSTKDKLNEELYFELNSYLNKKHSKKISDKSSKSSKSYKSTKSSSPKKSNDKSTITTKSSSPKKSNDKSTITAKSSSPKKSNDKSSKSSKSSSPKKSCDKSSNTSKNSSSKKPKHETKNYVICTCKCVNECYCNCKCTKCCKKTKDKCNEYSEIYCKLKNLFSKIIKDFYTMKCMIKLYSENTRKFLSKFSVFEPDCIVNCIDIDFYNCLLKNLYEKLLRSLIEINAIIKNGLNRLCVKLGMKTLHFCELFNIDIKEVTDGSIKYILIVSRDINITLFYLPKNITYEKLFEIVENDLRKLPEVIKLINSNIIIINQDLQMMCSIKSIECIDMSDIIEEVEENCADEYGC